MSARIRLPEQNHVLLTGRLTHDPELRYTQKNQAICRFSIAVNRNYKDANGNWQKDVSFIPIIAWRDTGLVCSQKLKKGEPVHISGRLKSREWEDKNGQKHKSLEVEVQRIQFLHIQETDKPEENVNDDLAEQPISEETNVPAAIVNSVEEEPF